MKLYIENLPQKLTQGVSLFCARYSVLYEKGGEELKVHLSLNDEISVCENTIFYKK